MINLNNSDDLISEQGVIGLKFSASWCQPCKMMNGVIAKLEEEFDCVKFISVDIDEVPDLATKYSIKTVPTLVVLENGNEVNRVVGLSYISNFRQLFNDLVG